jgi:uncharacterized protein YdcH (DUF465 family)
MELAHDGSTACRLRAVSRLPLPSDRSRLYPVHGWLNVFAALRQAIVHVTHRRTLMFEHRQEKLEQLLKDNVDFRRIFNQHQELDKRVTAAEIGTAPMEDLALNQLKKEKLWAKDRLARMMDTIGG